MSIIDLVAKIEKLSPEKQVEVEDFIDFLVSKRSSTSDQENAPHGEKNPLFGSSPGMFVMHDDFDAPLDDFKDYMYP